MEEMLNKGMFKGHCDGQANVIGQIVGSEDARIASTLHDIEKCKSFRNPLTDWYKHFAGKEPSEKALKAMVECYAKTSNSYMGVAARQHRIEHNHKKLVEAEARAVRALYTYPSDGFTDGLPIGSAPLTAEEFALNRLQAKKSRTSRRREKNRLIKAGIIRLSDDVLCKNVEKATKERVEYERIYAEFLA